MENNKNKTRNELITMQSDLVRIRRTVDCEHFTVVIDAQLRDTADALVADACARMSI